MDLTFLYKLFPRTVFFVSRITNANYEDDMKLLGLLCCRKRVSLDIGAKVGMYTWRLAEASGKVIGFEPVPELARLLRKALGNVSNVEIRDIALSSAPGKAKLRFPIFRFGVPKYGLATIEPDNRLNLPAARRIRTLEVDLQTIDQLAGKEIGFIKIDVEGHEMKVLEGARKVLKRHRPALVIEGHESMIRGAPAKLTAFLEPFGYSGYFIRENKLLPIKKYKRGDPGAPNNFIFIQRQGGVTAADLQARLSA